MILVSGAAGLLGREVVRLLVERGTSVRALDVVPETGPAPVGVDRRTGDLMDPEVCRAAVAGAGAVVHAAAVQFRSPGYRRFRSEPYFGRNAETTRRLLAASIAAGVQRFVFVSSGMVYGRPGVGALREDRPLGPLGPYGRSKVASEAHCHAARQRIAHLTILRPSVIIGPGRLGLMKTLFDAVRTHRAIPIFGQGHNRHHMVAVTDLAEACRLALDRPGHGTYNIGSLDPPTVRVLLGELCRRAGSRSRLLALPTRPAQLALQLLWSVRFSPMNPEQFRIAPTDYVLDISAARTDLGFEPREHDTDTLCATYRWYVASLNA